MDWTDTFHQRHTHDLHNSHLISNSQPRGIIFSFSGHKIFNQHPRSSLSFEQLFIFKHWRDSILCTIYAVYISHYGSHIFSIIAMDVEDQIRERNKGIGDGITSL